MVITTSGADIELIDGSTVVPLMLARPVSQDGEIVETGPLTIEEALVASGAGLPLAEWLEPLVIEDWFSGIGLAYDAAPGCDTFSAPGYVLPSGAATDVVLPAANTSASPIVALSEYGGSLWAAQKGTGAAATGRVMRSTDGGVTWADSLNLLANEQVFDLLVAMDGSSGAMNLYASSTNMLNGSGRLHRWSGTGPWVSTPIYPAAGSFGTNGRNQMVKVFWEGEDGVGDWRIVVIAHQGFISYTRPGSDPMDAAAWVEGVRCGAGENLYTLAAARRHVYALSAENIYDLDEQGNSPALTSYTLQHSGNALCSLYLDGFVYRSMAMGLDRVRVDQGPILQESPGICSPGWATKAESAWLTGYPHALTSWLGGVVLASWQPAVGRSALFWGKPREVLGIESPNPLIWHGPFGITSTADVVTRMMLTSSDVNNVGRLWLATWPTSQLDPPALSWMHLPPAGGAFSDLIAAGGYRYASGAGSGIWQPYSRLYGLSTTLGDKGSKKHLYQLAIGSRNLGTPTAATKLTVYNRADPAPSSSAWGTGVDVTSGPVLDITPSVTSGHRLETRIDLFSPSGGATPPVPAVLDSVRWTYWRTAPDLDTWTFDVEYGDGVVGIGNTAWTNLGRDVSWYSDALVAMARAGRVTMRDRQNNRWSVKLKHYLPRESRFHDGAFGRTVQARITVALLGAA